MWGLGTGLSIRIRWSHSVLLLPGNTQWEGQCSAVKLFCSYCSEFSYKKLSRIKLTTRRKRIICAMSNYNFTFQEETSNLGPPTWRSTIWAILVPSRIGIAFIFRFHRRPIQLVVFVSVGLSSFLPHLLQVILGVEVASVPGLDSWPLEMSLTEMSINARNGSRQGLLESPCECCIEPPGSIEDTSLSFHIITRTCWCVYQFTLWQKYIPREGSENAALNLQVP